MEFETTRDIPLLELYGIKYVYASLEILKGVNLKIYPGEVHAIAGEHGAGKSTLSQIISGFLRPQIGRMVFNKCEIESWNAEKAIEAGIEYIHQENPIIESGTVEENMFLNIRSKSNNPFLSRKKNIERVNEYLSQFDFGIKAEDHLKDLKTPDKVIIDILKHIYRRPNLLILDEALQKISGKRFNKMIQLLNTLKNQGTAIIFITHRIDDIYTFADKVSILRNGELLITDSVKNIDKVNVIKLAYTQIDNVTQKEEASKEFYSLLKYNEAVLKKLPVNLIVIDSREKIKLINESARSYFNIKESNYLNMPLRKLLNSNLEIYKLLEEQIQKGNSGYLISLSFSHNEKKAVINIKIDPIFDESFLIGHYLIFEDITDIEHMREQMIFSEKLASIGLLSAGVAHEINNPLEVIGSNIQYLKFNIDDLEFTETLQRIEDEIDSISQITGNLISFSDKDTRNKQCIKPEDIIKGILNLVRIDSENRKIKISFSSEKDYFIDFNRTEFKQIILNIIKNSFEAMPEGGNLKIILSESFEDDRKMMKIEFIDSGCGICPEDVGNIFLPFHSAKSGNSTNLGMGLSISYGIISRNNGKIEVSNTPEGGCCFTILLPAAVTKSSK